MKIKDWLVLLVTVTSATSMGIFNTAKADLFPTDSIEKTTIVLQPRGDEADVYFPNPSTEQRIFFENAFPIVAMLQAAAIDKSFYMEFGIQLARYGFVVVIPNHSQTPPGAPSILLPDQDVIIDIITQMKLEDTDPMSSLYLIIDSEKMGLTGHSFGGAAGLFAISGNCFPPFCYGPPTFPLPQIVMAGAFYGTNTCGTGGKLADPACINFSTIPPNPNPEGQLFDINNGNIPVALVQGELDGISTPAEGKATFNTLEGEKTFITIKGANHFGITDENNPPANPDPNTPELLPPESVWQIADSVAQYFIQHVKDNSKKIVQVDVDQDSWLKEAAPSDSFGDEKELPVKNKNGDSERAVLSFDLSNIPTFSTIQSATARFRVTTPDNALINIYRVTNDWTEFGVNWNNIANEFDNSTEYGSFAPFKDDAFVSVDITSLVQKWICGTPNQGIMLIATSKDNQSKYYSKEMDIASYRPSIKVDVGTNPFPCSSFGK